MFIDKGKNAEKCTVLGSCSCKDQTIQKNTFDHAFVSISKFDIRTGKGLTGVVCRDVKGSILTSTTKAIFANSPLVAETLAIRKAVSLDVTLKFPKAIFESDCQTLTEACSGNIVKGGIKSLIKDIHHLKSKLTRAGFTWIGRDGSHVAHVPADLASFNSLCSN